MSYFWKRGGRAFIWQLHVTEHTTLFITAEGRGSGLTNARTEGH